jgi:quinoprotein glucose dehydrogenase
MLRSCLLHTLWASFLFGISPVVSSEIVQERISLPFQAPKVLQASEEGELAMRRFVLPAGFQVELFAAEPDLANPVAFHIDEQGRFYVVETFRHSDGVLDIRGRRTWLDEDLAARTVDDRLAMLKRHLGENVWDLTRQTERIKLIEDTTGDGKADSSTVYADGFNTIVDGIAAGILSRRGQVWFGNIPNLWQLQDTTRNGEADYRRVLLTGFGVRIGFLGHDLHGLRFGPDGKLYFSVGDRGSHVVTEGRVVADPDSGSVFRCNPDGSELELFSTGLRNPQEIIFDQYGNLFTGDNNSDGGDKARWLYLVEGGDYGWRIGYQFIERPNSRGPWNAEKMWRPYVSDQPAFLLPAIANFTDGPSGLTYYPGTGFPERYRNYFFLADFHGGKGSGIHAFTVKANGAWFELMDRHNFIWEALPTDVDFGVDGALYWTDWVEGWNKTGKGRIYRLYHPETVNQPVVGETRKLLSEGMEKRSMRELSRLLAHPDMRVRQEAQFQLASWGGRALKTLRAAAENPDHQLARIHAIWALGQMSNPRSPREYPHTPAALPLLFPLLKDRDAEVRAQTAKVLGEARAQEAFERLVELLKDDEPRVRFFAAQALGKLGREKALEPVLAMIRENDNRDPYLRHAGVMTLVGIGNLDRALRAAADPSPAVRMAVLLTLRRFERAELALFLNDPDPLIVMEAIRAINDLPISGALPELAGLIERSDWPLPAMRRIINANFRLGTPGSAGALAQFAAQSDAPVMMRVEALECLSTWAKPSGRDRITSLWRPVVAQRESKTAAEALQPVISKLLLESPDPVRAAAASASARLEIRQALSALVELGRQETSGPVKISILNALAGLNYPGLLELLQGAERDSLEEVRKEALRLRARLEPGSVLRQVAQVLENGSLLEKQGAFATLVHLPGREADLLVTQWMERLMEGLLPEELHLDLLEAARRRDAPEVEEQLQRYEAFLPEGDPLRGWRPLLHGGNAVEGRRIFFEQAEVSCLRCHQLNGEGGNAGPDLTGFGARQSREYILESVLFPNRRIAPGFETVILTLRNGTVYAGIVERETDHILVLNSPEDGSVTMSKADIVSRKTGLSGMPERMDELLTRQELRSLVEFLARQK